MTRRVRVVATAAALSAAVLLGTVVLPSQAAEPTAGSNGIGDPYFPTDGNGGYDVAHYNIHDTYRLGSGRVTGYTRFEATATQDLSRFNLDLVLRPSQVNINGHPVDFHKASTHELVVVPDKPLLEGQVFTVKVAYTGIPSQTSAVGISPFFSNAREAMAMNEPQIAPWWFAANDHPRDKARFDIHLRVKKGIQAISNGERVSRTATGKWVRTHWHMDQEMAPYLAFFAVGRFDVATGTDKGLPYTVAVSKQLSDRERTQGMALLTRSPKIVRWLERRFGAYPFDSTGGVMTSLDTGFALENQSRPTYPWLGTGHGALTTVVHELAHQWFGDSISVDRWRDIWLNEGFASFAEVLYDEAHRGPDGQEWLESTHSEIPASAGFWDLRIANPGADGIFDQPVYLRGAMTLQALRHRIGEDDFFTTMRSWVEEGSLGNARSNQFEDLAESVSGEDLSGFFEHWLRTGSRPAATAENGLA